MIRLQDIAEMAGVSRTTVSNVINGNTKRVSQETIDKRDDYDSLLGDLHTDYLNFMAQKQITVIYDIENGEKRVLSRNNKVYSFERWLNMNGHKTLAMWFRRNFKGSLEKFNFKDFV